MDLANNKLMTVAMAGAVGAIVQGLTFATYGFYKDKGYSNWQSGAATGAILGVASAAVLVTTKGVAMATANNAVSGCLGGGCSGLRGVTLTALPKAIGLFTAQDLSGVTVEQLSGVPGLRVVA